MEKFKNFIKQNKKKLTTILVAVLLVIVYVISLIYQKTAKNGIGVETPELAKAMTYPQVQEGEKVVDDTNNCVEFDAFFLRDINNDGYAESIRGTSKQIGKEDTLYMELNVQTAGSLKDAKITINGENFYLQTALPKDNELIDNYIGSNIKEIKFNELQNGTQKMVTGMVRSGDYSYSSRKAEAIGNNINNYSKTNSVTLTGIYVADDKTETPITKTVNFDIDWYGETKAEMPTNIAGIKNLYQEQDINEAINEEEGTFTVDFNVGIQEVNNELNLKKAYIEGVIPELCGYAPTNVEITGTNVTYTYDEQTKKFTAQREAKVDEDGNITVQAYDGYYANARYNKFNVKATYPIEAFEAIGSDAVEYRLPVTGYYEGYNNQSKEFTNPYKSNIAEGTFVLTIKNPEGDVARFDITVGTYVFSPEKRYIISKQKPIKLYNGTSEEEKDDTYQVRWYASTGSHGETEGLIMKETKDGELQVSDQFIKTNGQEDSMENVTTNIGIAFSGADNLLKEDGWIKVYDEDTGNLLVTFTKADWNKYTQTNPYKYEIPVKHIRVETSETNINSGLYVYNIKELDNEYIVANYTREQFDGLQYIKSTLTGYIGERYVNTDINQAEYEGPFSLADISLSNNNLSTQTTEKNEKITITARKDELNNQIGWIDGSFLVTLPEEILTAEINNVEINNSQIELTSYELIEQDGVKFIKINTTNKTQTEQTYSITIDVNLTPDPRIATSTRQVELYASNEAEGDYYYKAEDIYDVNDNLNTTEQINKTSTSISLIAPNSLLTNQIISNYDNKGSTVISPQIADIKPIYSLVGGEQQATIGVQIRNNYTSTISEIKILGKIPFEGNTYVLNGGDLGSTFTTKMLDTGIQIPEELKQYATIYYSENENPSQDINDQANGWKTADQVTNWDNIKTYVIDLGSYQMPTGAEYVFNYTVKIPNGLNFNQVAYSHHAIYFALDTEQGRYRTQTEPNKVGIRVAEKYNLEITKTQTGKDKVVPGATYRITDQETGESKTGVTNAQGQLTINNLYAEKIYEIQEIKTPNNYELNSDVIRFIGHVDENGNLTIEKTSGTPKEDMQVIKNEGEDYKVTVKVEDEARASLKITKKEQGTQNLIQGARFKLTGYDLPENGRTITTTINGEATLSGLSINQEYTLQEVKAEGYYLANPIKFKIVNNNGNYTLEKIQDETATGEIKDQTTTEEDSIPTISITLENEKIPTYSMQLIKVKRTTESTVSDDELIAQAETSLANTEVEYLEGAKFKLYKGTEEIGEYTTDETGTVTIDNLYQYETEKDIDQTYTLKEVLAPDGYAKVKDITFKVQNQDGTLVLTTINEDGEEQEGQNYVAEGNTIKLTIQDSPSFKLIKKDAETKNVLANVKFAIYNVDTGVEEPATNSKGELIGTKETINGKEYYTLTTDQNGEITADLTEGLYKAVELQAPDQYNITDKAYYFGVGASREGKQIAQPEWAKTIGGTYTDRIQSVAETSDGGYVVGGYFTSSSIELEDNVTLINNSSTATRYSDGMIIKYDANRELQWAKVIGGVYYEYITSVASTRDGGIIAVGYFSSKSIDIEDKAVLDNKGNDDGMIIKYTVEGNVEWAKSIGGISHDRIQSVASTSDGGYIVGGYYQSSSIDLGNNVTLTNHSNSISNSDGMVIKYDQYGNAEWANSIGGINASDAISSVVQTEDQNYIAVGYYQSSEIQVEDTTLTNNGSADGMLIKYDKNGKILSAKTIGGDKDDFINSVASTSDGGYIIGGYYQSSSINLENEISLTNKGNNDGLIIKYDAYGIIEWTKAIGGISNDRIQSVAETSDGGYIAGGYFNSNGIDLGNGITLDYSNDQDGIVIKYDTEGEVEWAKVIGGSSTDQIRTVASTSDGRIIVGGDFESSNIDLGNNVTLKKNTSFFNVANGMIIELTSVPIPEIVTKQAIALGESDDEQIQSVTPTSDGGYIAGGYFNSSSINLGNGVTLTNNGDEDGFIIKYDARGKVQWAKSIGESKNDRIQSVAETRDGGYIVGGYFNSSSINLGNDVILNNNGSQDGMIIKYDENGEVQWAKAIGGSTNEQINSVASTSDGGVIVVGDAYNSRRIDLGNGVILTTHGSFNFDGIIIKYDVNGITQWAKAIGGTGHDYIDSITSTSDGGVIVGGEFDSDSIDLGNDVTINNAYAGNSDGMIIKYSSTGEVEWATSVGSNMSECIYSVVQTSDGGVIVGGEFSGDSIDLGNDVILINNSSSYFSTDGMIIKYDSKGDVQWAKAIGGNLDEQILSVNSTSDGGVLVGGNFESNNIYLGNNVVLNNNSSEDGMIIKYDENGEAQWAKAIGGSDNDYIQSVAQTNDGLCIAGGYFESSRIGLGDDKELINNGGKDGLIIKLNAEMGAPEIQELTIENSRKEFKITTDVKEINGVKGGNISGEDKNPYESVKYGDTNVNEIKMTPDTNYEIISITVNGKEYPFEVSVDGTYTMPPFTDIKEDKHIEVTYALKSNKITINKVDGVTEQPLSGATFKLDQIEERTEPENVVGNLTDNGQEYAVADIEAGEVTEVQGELTNNGDYYFVKNTDGTLTPTNSKTYQLANGGTTGIQNVTANSYIPINLQDKEGQYVVVVNAKVSSESVDYGYATIKEDETAPLYNYTAGRFMYISGTSTSSTTPTDYTSEALEGGKTYYLHLGYRKDNGVDIGDDQVVINSVKIYKAKGIIYNFVENGKGGYESTNQEKDNTTANSYIPIDLRDYTGKYNLIVNAQISSQSGDYGYAVVTSNTDRVPYNATEKFMFITGTITSKDYTTVLQGGQMYYLHLGYYKNASTSTGDDKFTVNSIKVTLNDSDLYHTEITTDSKGQAVTQVPFGKYQITEIQAPEGYEKIENPITIEFREKGNNVVTNENNVQVTVNERGEFVITNNEKAKVIVQHYLKDENGNYTETKLAEDEYQEGESGKKYTTSPKLDLGKYELEKDEEGNYVIPGNATGTYTPGTTIVKYYYEKKEIPLTIHHYIEGTIEKVPLKNGGTAEDVTDSGKEGEQYVTNAISDEDLDPKYELVETPTNATGTYGTEEIIVTYYYKLAERPLTIQKTGEDGEPLSGVRFKIVNVEEKDTQDAKEYTTNAEGKINVTLKAGTYEITETATQEGYSIPENPTQTIEITKAKDSYNLSIVNPKAQGTVITHYYIEGTEEKVPSNVEGQVVEDVTQTGNIGDIYITQEAINVSDKYELKEIVGDVQGTIEEGTKEIIYYYALKETDLTLVKTNEQGEGLEGANFKIENKESGKVKYVTTGANGEITKKVEIGEYVVTEERAPEGYRLNKNPQTINVELNKENKITITNKKINYFELKLNKVDSETNEKIPGANFTLSYTTQYGEQKTEQYQTSEDGTITLNNLEDEIVYTLKETGTPKGYIRDTEEKQFVVHYIDGKYELEVLKGSFKDTTIENSTVEVNVANTPSFKLIKQDENGLPIQGVKFTITDEQGQEVTNGFGNPVGELEEINGEQQRVLTTNENGVIAENLLPGKYILTEVQTPSKYVLPEESQRTQTIEITSEGFEKTYVEQKDVIEVNWENLNNLENMFYDNQDTFDTFTLDRREITADGKIIYSLGLMADFTIPGEYTATGEDFNLQVIGGMENAINVITTPDGKVENVVLIKTDEGSASVGTNIFSLSNGDYITLGMYMGTIKIPAEDTTNNQELTLSTSEDIATFMAKYNSEGKIESLKDITYLTMNLNDYYNIEIKELGNKITITYPYDDYQLTIPARETATGEEITVNNQSGTMLVNLNSDFKVIDAYSPNNIDDSRYEQEYEEQLSTGEVIVGGYNNSPSLIFTEDETTSGERIELYNNGDGIITKYDANGKVEWAKELGSQAGFGGYYKISEVSDGYLAIAYYQDGDLIIPAEETVYGEEIKLENQQGDDKQSLIKYTRDGQVEWAVDVDQNIEFNADSIIKETQNGYSIFDANNGIIVSYEKVHDTPIVKEQNVVTIQNEIANGNVIVHHYKENTTESLSADKTITGKIDTNYETEPATDIPANYELVATPENARGTIKEGTTEVIYYYRLKDPEIINPQITKESNTEKVTEKDQVIDYDINYSVTIDQYIGKATVTIVDELPYEINLSSSNIAGGTYNQTEKTITWVETIENIDTYTKGAEDINITKEISLVYKDIDTTKTNISNKATGTIKLETPEKEQTVEDTKDVPTEYLVNIPVTKVWNDNENAAGKRPTSVTIQVKNGEQVVAEETLSAVTNWKHEFSVAKYDSLGKEITYTVSEKAIEGTTGIFYTTENTEVTGDQVQGFKVTNTFEVPDEKVSVNVTKNWVDTELQKDKRPEKVTLILSGNGLEYKQEIETEENKTITFNNLPKYDTNGDEIVYTVREEGNNQFYTVGTPTGNMQEGYTITNTFTRPEDQTQKKKNKIWEDNETQANRRPESIILVVKNEDQEVKTQEITKDNIVEGTTNQWSTIITGLQKYDENGQEIKYTVEEKEKNPGDLKFYEVEEAVVPVEDNQATIRNSFKTPSDTTEITVNKVWVDTELQQDKRPEKVTLVLSGNGQEYKQEITTEEDKTVTFDNLPKYDANGDEIVYTVREEGNNKFYKVEEVTGNMQEGYTITNTFNIPNENVEITVNKVWVDNEVQANRRPEVIVINVKGEDEKVVATYELNTKTETSHTFTELPKYNSNGNEIIYTIEEAEKTAGDLYFYEKEESRVTNVFEEENKKQATITNTFKRPDETTNVTVTKIWEDNNNEAEKRPESIKLQLKNGTTIAGEQEINEENAVKVDENTWQYTFTGVDKYNEDGEEINYTVDETELNSNDLQFYNKELQGTTVKNIFTQNTDTVDIPVTKIWEDNKEQAERRPESVIIVLNKNGEKEKEYELNKETAETSNENTWTYTFKDLPKYDQYNNIINYTIEEKEKNAGDLKFYTAKVEGTTITNTFTNSAETISIEVNKKWQDQENIYNKRPISIKVQVKNGDTIADEKIVTKENNWSAIFTKLPKYNENGQEINYTVDEEVDSNVTAYYDKMVGEVTNKEDKENEKEATITNTMIRIPSKVIVKYVDINTDEEISDRTNKEGIIGTTFDVTKDVKDITGYTLVKEPEEKTGTYTAETQEKIYYYAKNTKVIVKYLEQDDTPEDTADNKVLAGEKTLLGYEGESYSTIPEDIKGYTLVDKTNNTSGQMQRDEIIVIYYYSSNTKVIVKYLEKDNTPNDNTDNKVLAPEETIDGYVGKEYNTDQKDITNYTYVEKTTNYKGTMTKEPIEVIYYYVQNTKVTVKYLEKDNTPEDNTDNQVLAKEETIEGYEGKEYKTEQKEIKDYTFVEDTENTEGTMTKEPIEVIYYYAQNTKATVQHIDRETGEILKQETENGKVGDIFKTHAEDFEGYVLVEAPEEPNVEMTKEEQIVKYYYAHISAGVIEKHIDDITGELLYSEEHKGNEGDNYDIPSKTFEGYDLVEEKLPDNSKGEMTQELIEVKYYYIKKAKVIVKYLEQDDTPEDTTDNKVLAEEETIEGHENDSYVTKAKEIKDYYLVETPENAKGTMTITENEDGTYNTVIEVIYYYKKQAGGVIENHIDITTNKKLATQKHTGHIGDEYDIPSRQFDKYDLVIKDKEGNNRLPENAKGTMTEEEIVVNYYYIKQAKVKVEYIDKQTGEKLDKEEIEGHVGDSYETEEKEFDGYDLVEKPSNGKGEMIEEQIIVKYYYERKAEVEIKYLEKETEFEIATSETIEGHVGDKYETEQKEIPYYKFVEKTENYKGKMEKDKITVIYYYEKQIFNLRVDKWVSGATIDGIPQIGQNYITKDQLYKVDIHRTKTTTANVKITYTIRISNTGEIEGTVGEIVELIPDGYTYNQEDNEIYWEGTNRILTTDALKDATIKPGEVREIKIVLRWNKGENNFGEKDNIVTLTNISNPAGYEDINKEDNSDKSEMIITISTGIEPQIKMYIIIGILLSLIATGIIIARRLRKMKP